MKLRHTVYAVLVFGLSLPQGVVAEDTRITPTLSTALQRTCQGEATRVVLMEQGVAVVAALPTIERQTRDFRASRARDGWAFEHSVITPSDEVTLRFETAPDGTVTTAAMSGPSVDALPRNQMYALATATAEDVPERLLLGRSFAVGDSYYPEDLQRNLLNRAGVGMGLPFAVNGSIDMRYEGQVEFEGRRAWRFAGRITASGSGEISGAVIAVDHGTEAVVLHDAETGLVLKYDTRADTHISRDGRAFRHLRKTDAFTCEIIPQ